jgi:hypothetical protein
MRRMKIRGERVAAACVAALFFAMALLAFHALLAPGRILVTNDQNYGYAQMWQRIGGAAWTRGWMWTLWGTKDIPHVQPSNYLELVSAKFYINWFQALALGLLGWFTALYLRDKGVRWAGCVLAGLVAGWVGTNFTLTGAGHFGKYGGLLFLGPALFALGRMGRPGGTAGARAAWGALAGACVAGMFFEQMDTGLLFAAFLFPVGVFEAVRGCGGWKPGALARAAVPALAVAGVGLAGIVLPSFHAGLVDLPEESPEAKWDYLTQWSQPPDESLDFVAPGWMGWSSGDESGPYHGRTGRSAEWETTHQGFMNYKTEGVYVGGGVLVFALLGLADARRRRRAGLAWLWGGLWAAGLLLSFGRYCPIYRLVAALPGFGNIRNPNKYLHFFQLAWGVLAGLGLDGALRLAEEAGGAAALRRWRNGAAAVAGVFAAWAAVSWLGMAGGTAKWAALGWPGPYARAIAETRTAALGWGALSFGAAAAALWGLGLARAGRWRAAAAWLPAAAVVFDCVAVLGPHYVRTRPERMYGDNALTDFLRREAGDGRVAIPLMNDAFYGRCVDNLFPAAGIDTITVTSLPRPPADYEAFFGAVRHPLRIWELTGVTHVLATAEVGRQIAADPSFGGKVRPVWGYNVSGTEGKVRPAGRLEGAAHWVLAVEPRPARAGLVRQWRVAEDGEALETLASAGFQPGREVLLAPGQDLPSSASADEAAEGSVRIEKAGIGSCSLVAETPVPALVRVAEDWAPGWRAKVDGKETPVLRCDYMFQTVEVPAGRHEVEMWYQADAWGVRLQALCLVLGAAAAVWLAAGAWRRRKADAA